jgi:hypothetical protein
MNTILAKLRTLFRRKNLETEMADEMRQHLERRAQEKIADGLSPEEARYAAQREFGGTAQLQQQCRDERRFIWLEQSAQDVRYAFRQLRRNPGFAATAIVTLALGIGLNTAIFSAAYGVLWRPLPYPDPDRLIIIQSAQQTETGPRTFTTWAPMSYEGLRPRATTLDHLAAYSSINAQLTGRGEPRRREQRRVIEIGMCRHSKRQRAALGLEADGGRVQRRRPHVRMHAAAGELADAGGLDRSGLAGGVHVEHRDVALRGDARMQDVVGRLDRCRFRALDAAGVCAVGMRQMRQAKRAGQGQGDEGFHERRIPSG